MGLCILFIIIGFGTMMFSIVNVNILFILVGFITWIIAVTIGIILEDKKRKKTNLPKKEAVKPVPHPNKENMYKYVCNNKSFIFHRPECSCVKDKYKDEYGYDRDAIYDYGSDYKNLILCGYKPCNKCKPR